MTFTADDARAAKMIGVLMMVAKLQEQQVKDKALSDEEEVMRSALRHASLMKTVVRMFQGGAMEQEVIAFAKRLGFQVEQSVITPGTKVPQ